MSFTYDPNGNTQSLAALSWLYGAGTRLRNWLYDKEWLKSHRAPLPVISVGNLTVGGNGKTPLCGYILKLLRENGLRPVLVTRGYGGSNRGPVLVQADSAIEEVGDEPLMLARRGVAPIVVSRKRLQGARFVKEKDFGDVVVLDDGFQHRQLYRNVDLVAVDVSDESACATFKRNHLLPRGPFREDRDQGLKRCSLVVFSSRVLGKPSSAFSELVEFLPTGVPHAVSHLTGGQVIGLEDGSLLEPQPVAAFCGIAKGEVFFESLAKLGFSVSARHLFRDHQRFSSSMVQELKRLGGGLPLVCTEKDAARLQEQDYTGVYKLVVEVEVEPAKQFRELLIAIAKPPGPPSDIAPFR